MNKNNRNKIINMKYEQECAKWMYKSSMECAEDGCTKYAVCTSSNNTIQSAMCSLQSTSGVQSELQSPFGILKGVYGGHVHVDGLTEVVPPETLSFNHQTTEALG